MKVFQAIRQLQFRQQLTRGIHFYRLREFIYMKFYVRDRFSVIGKSDLREYLKVRLLGASQNLSDRFITPIETSRDFLFIVGCGHSGTTLAAARLGQHPDAMLVGRESGIFSPPYGLLCAKQVVSTWADVSEASGKKFVIEKTPKHVLSIGKIRALIPGAKFLLMTRNPLDNIASLSRRIGDLDAAVRRWNLDNKAACKWLDCASVRVVKYEDLTTRPAEKLAEALAHCGLGWSDDVLNPSSGAYGGVAQKGNMAEREAQVSRVIHPNNNKWREVFSRKQAEGIIAQTGEVAARLGYDLSAMDI